VLNGRTTALDHALARGVDPSLRDAAARQLLRTGGAAVTGRHRELATEAGAPKVVVALNA
jgi:hypothetical protein